MKKIVVSIIALALVLCAMASMAQDKSYTITPKFVYGFNTNKDSKDYTGNSMGILVDADFASFPVGVEAGYLWNDKSCNLFDVLPGKYKGHIVPVMATYKQSFTPENPFYFMVGAGIAINEYKWKGNNIASGLDVSESKTKFAYKVGVGYKFANNLSAEVAYADYGKSKDFVAIDHSAEVFRFKTAQIQLGVGYSF